VVESPRVPVVDIVRFEPTFQVLEAMPPKVMEEVVMYPGFVKIIVPVAETDIGDTPLKSPQTVVEARVKVLLLVKSPPPVSNPPADIEIAELANPGFTKEIVLVFDQ